MKLLPALAVPTPEKMLSWVGIALAAAFTLLWFFLPREPLDTAVRFDPGTIGENPEAYFARREAAFDDITPGAQKSIRWAGKSGARTNLVLVYLHGFSATAAEIRPVPEKLAERLGANLVFTRLKGHGRRADAMSSARATDWLDDLDEALAVARAIGDRVVVIGTSTGATLATVGFGHGRTADAAIFVAPNFRVAAKGSFALTLPGARLWLPAVMGPERGFEPINAEQERYWTTRYPSLALIPMAALVAEAGRVDHAAIEVPVLFYFSDEDTVVDHVKTREVAAAWGGPTKIISVEIGPGDDPSAHVIAGDIVSPGRTAVTVDDFANWLQSLDELPEV